ncbi:MAG: hypothetical protein FJY65_11380, partial [Calditrichaeota bacterium]|nr:hypothetical protein [Calditrichota bacterium]
MDTMKPSTEALEDNDGFLMEMSHWSREIAEKLALKNDLGPLTEDHWKIIEYVKDYYQPILFI